MWAKDTHVVVLALLPLFQIVLLCLQFDDLLPKVRGLQLKLVYAHVVQDEGLDTERQRNLLLLFQLLLGLVALNLS